MDPLSRRPALIRYIAIITAMSAIAFLASSPKSSFSILFIIFAALISLKYPFFDGIVRMFRGRWPAFKVLPWLWVGYVTAAITDVVATWMTVADETGASLALAASSVFITPSILAVSLILMAIHTSAARKLPRKHAKRTV